MNEEAKGFIKVILFLAIIGAAVYFLVTSLYPQTPKQPTPQGKLIPVQESVYDSGVDEAYLYVPGDASTCNWTYYDAQATSSTSLQSFTSQPDQNGEHEFLFNATSVTDIQVQCLSSEGIQYAGQMPSGPPPTNGTTEE